MKTAIQIGVATATVVGLLFLQAGCAALKYETADGTKVTYTRFLTTSDSISGDVGDAKVQVSKQQIDTTTLQAIIQLLGAVK